MSSPILKACDFCGGFHAHAHKLSPGPEAHGLVVLEPGTTLSTDCRFRVREIECTVNAPPYGRPISVALLPGFGTKDISWGTLGALAYFSTVPIVLLALFLNRYFVQGLTKGIH